MAFYNPNAGINMNVDMGMYKVIYKPRRNTIRVSTFEDNLNNDGFIHPHIMGTNNGDICWGNAANTYSRSMTDQTPSKAFAALRILLQTYNDESPYRPIMEFALIRDPDLFKDKEIVKAKYREAWVDEDDLPANVAQRYLFGDNDPDEEESLRHHVYVFRDEYKGTGVQVPGSEYYVELTDGTYAEVTIYDWY